MSKNVIDASEIYTAEELEEKFKDSFDAVIVRLARGPNNEVEIFSQVHRAVEDFEHELKLEICNSLQQVAESILSLEIPAGETIQ